MILDLAKASRVWNSECHTPQVVNMSRSKSLSISLRDLRIAKIERKSRMTPCGAEFDAYLSGLARAGGDDSKVPDGLSKALLECMGRDNKVNRPASVQFHLAKFVKRK